MKRLYEIPVVFRIINPESEMQQAIEQVVTWLENSEETENVGKVVKIDRAKLGRRRLAYEIKGQRDGFYVLIYANVEPSHLPEFELNMRLFDPVLRYLILVDEETKAEKEEVSEVSEEVSETSEEVSETSEEVSETSEEVSETNEEVSETSE